MCILDCMYVKMSMNCGICVDVYICGAIDFNKSLNILVYFNVYWTFASVDDH